MKNQQNESWKLFLFLFSLSLLLFFLDKNGLLAKPKNFFQKPVLEVQKFFYSSFNLKFSFNPFVSKKQLALEINELEEKLNKLSSAENELQVCREENEKMKKLLGSPLPPSWKFLPAKVIAQGEKIKIDKGKKEGVAEGMVVVLEKNLVGKVIQTEEDFSLLITPKTPQVKIPVLVRRPGKNENIIQAEGLLISSGGQIILDQVLQKEDIQKGDLVVTKGDGWPADILIGEIEEVFPISAEIYRKAKVKPLVDFNKLRTVFVVIKQ